MTETKSLAQAVAMLQTRLPRIEKAQTADVKSDKARYSYSYADLAQVTRALMPVLGELGLSFIAKPTNLDGRFVLAYKLMHVSGEAEAGEYPLPTSGTPQAIGSAITYARRYCLCAVTGVAPESDDDGAAAQAEADRSAQGSGRTAWRAPESTSKPTAGDSKVSQPQLQKLHAQFSQAAWTDKADRLRAASTIIGRDLTSATEMTRAEASKVIDALTQVVAHPDPADRLTVLLAEIRGDEQGGTEGGSQ